MIKPLLKKAASISGLTALSRHITRNRPAILMYHGLTNNPGTQDWTQVPIDDFRNQMRHIRESYHPVALSRLVMALENGRIEPHSVAVTFDDGYQSNYELACPILREFDIPATIFVTSGFISQPEKHNRYLWPDFITAMLKTHEGHTLDLGKYGLDQYDLTSPRNIYASREAICQRLKSIAAAGTNRIIVDLYEKYGGGLDHDRFVDYRPMTADQIRELASGGLITIGAHSRSHSILSRLSPDKLEDEITGCKHDLKALSGVEVNEFAYPNGRWEDINRDVYEITARSYNCAVTTVAGLNSFGHDKYLLRRLGIGRNLDIGQFRALISGTGHLLQTPIRRYHASVQG